MRLGDLVDLVRGNTYKSKLLSETDGPVLLGLGSIARNGGFKYGAWKHYPGDSDPRILLHPGDIYASLKDLTQACDLLGAVSRVPDDLPEGRLTQDTVKLVFHEGTTEKDRLYAYWSLRSPQYRAYCKARGTGTTNMSLSRADFLDWQLPEQCDANDKLIATFEAIETLTRINQQTNDYLAAMAESIFEDWLHFAEGEPTPLSSFATFNPSTYSPKENWPTVAYVDTGSVTRNHFEKPVVIDTETEKLPSRARRKVENGDVIYSTVRPNQLHYGLVINPPSNMLVSTGFTVVRDAIGVGGPFIYLALARPAITTMLQSVAEQSTSAYPSIKSSDLEQLEVPLPTSEELEEIRPQLDSLFAAIAQNQTESKVLEELRDALLPKLMSGEIDVSQVGLTPPNNHLCDC